MVRIKGHEINPVIAKNSFDRRGLQYKNKIISNLRKLGLSEDDIEVPLERVAIKKAPASVTMWFESHRLFYSYSRGNTFVDNLYIVQKLIELEVEEVLNGLKTEQDFCLTFSEDKEVVEQRKEARELLGVAQNCVDMQEINQKYKLLAKKCHPDIPEGDHELFQKLNKAHKLLKRELE
jgi:hypothetical protein